MKDPIRFYGYKHWTLEDPSRCFNVGKGRKCRPHSKNDRNHKWHHNVKRLGLRVEVCIGPVTEDEAWTWEKENIKLMGTRSNNHVHNDDTDIGCNFTDGGEGGSGRVKSLEERAKLSKAHLGKKHTAETRAKLSEASRNPSPETRAKLRAARFGRIVTSETRAKLSIANKGHTLSPEQRAKISKAVSNPSSETRAKMSAAHKGKKHTAKTRAKMSEAARKRCNLPKEDDSDDT